MLANRSISSKKRWLGLLSVIFLISMSFAGLLNLSPVVVLADNANNDTVGNAEEILPNTHMGSLNATDLEDYYKIQLVPGSIITILFAADSVNNQDLQFYNPSMVEVFSLVSSASAQYSDSYYLANETTTNYWYIKISTFDGFGNYNFTLSIQKQNDAGTGDDVPADFGNAVEISPGLQIQGHLEDLDVTDMYKVFLTSDSIVTINFAADSVTTQDLDFYNPSMTSVFNLYSSASAEYSDMYYLANETIDNYWYIKISTFDGFGNYNFTVIVTFQNDAGSGGDVPPDFTNAFEITTETQISGHLEDLDTIDMYKVNLSSGSIVTITFYADSLYAQDLDLYLPEKTIAFNLVSSNSIIVSDNYTIANETATGYWYVKVSTFNGFDNYNFTVSVLNQNDGDSGKDVAQDFDKAYEVETGIWHSGYLGDLDNKDMYKVLVGGGYKVYINFSYATNGYMTLTFYDQDRIQQFTLPSTVVDPIDTGGTLIPDFWYVSVVLNSGSWGNYSFSVIVEKLDMTPPKIFNITVDPSEYFVVITWNTDVNTNGTVYYGLDETYGSEADSFSYFPTTSHTVYIYDAEPGKQYHFKIVSYSELGSKNESADTIFKVPRSTEFAEPQYNSLRIFIFGESMGTTRGYSVGSQVKITVYCFDKGVAIKPDTLNVTSDSLVDDITMTEVASGKYTGTYTLTQADIDGGIVNIFADVKYQGDNDTAILSFPVADDTGGDWEVNIDYFAPDDRNAGSGDTINLKVTVTKDGTKADPANIYASVQEEGYYWDRRGTRSRYTELTPTKITTGEYKISYAIPAVINESTEYEFEVDISDTTYSEYDYFSHNIDFYRVWYHQLSLTDTSAEFDLYATDLDNKILPNANIVVNWTYYTLEYSEKGGEINKQTDTNGKANFKFNYPDIGENYFDIEGKVTANGKTQHFDQYLSISDTNGGFIPEPYGDEFEIIPTMGDGSPYSYYDVTPDAQGNIKRNYIAYSYYEPLVNTKIFYYIISGSSPYYSYLSALDESLSVVKFGSATTNDTGVFSIEVKHSTTRAEPDFAYYTIYAEAALGTFVEFMPYSEVTSRDGMYYAEAFNYFYVSGIPYLFTFNDLISGDVKITITKLNKGDQTDIEVTYSGSFTQPMVMINFLPGAISINTPVMEMSSPKWGLWTDDDGIFLTKSNGKFSGKFTIPAFIEGETFSIMAIVQDYQTIMDEEAITSITDYTKINMVSLKVGESVTNGGYEGPTDGPPPLDSDLDGFIDDIEKFYGTDPQDPTSYPGSNEDDVFVKQTINNVEVLVLAKTSGNITIKSISPSEVTEIPKNIGKSFNFFIDISCDAACSDVQIVLDLGKIGSGIIPAGTDGNSIKLFYFDDTTNKWTEVADCSYNKNTGMLTAKLDHLTVFSPMSKAAEKDGETDKESRDLLMYILLLIIIVGVISAFGITLRKRKKGKGEGRMVEDRIDYYDSGEGGDMEFEEPPREPKIEPERGTQEQPEPAPTTDEGPGTVAPMKEATATTPPAPAPTPPKTTAEPETTVEAPITQEEKPATAETEETPPTTGEPQSVETPTTEPTQPTQEPSVQPPEQELKTPETKTSEPEPEKPAQPAAQETEAPVQKVPCPTCHKEIPVYSSPCEHCGTSLNW